jgi:putative component of membrane protein insertase Oxa1/YidC/SpoIIIJ protein YidD
MAINCCYGCVPPKRTPTCKFDGTCNKYAEEKKKHDALKAADDKRRAVGNAIYYQRCIKVDKAMKNRQKG